MNTWKPNVPQEYPKLCEAWSQLSVWSVSEGFFGMLTQSESVPAGLSVSHDDIEFLLVFKGWDQI